jgi:23S rRNA (guanosine2251-2'-O)-methyltransferase
VPDHRHKPGDDDSGGHKPGGRKPRPDGHRPQGPRSEGPRPEGARFQGPRPAGGPGGFEGRGGPRREGPPPGGFRPEGPRPEGRGSYGRPGGFEGRGGRPGEGPRPGGFRADGGGFEVPRPYGRPAGGRSFGPRPVGRPGGFSGPRPGGFSGPRPGGPRPESEGGAPGGEGGGPRAPRREWQAGDAWTPRPPRPSGAPSYGPRPRFGDRPHFGEGRPPGRPEFDPRREGFRPRHEEGAPGDSAGEARPPRDAEYRPGGYAGPRRGGPAGPRPGFGGSHAPRPRPGFGPGHGPRRPGSGFDVEPEGDAAFPQAEGPEEAGEGFSPVSADASATDSTPTSEGGNAQGGRPAGQRPLRPSPRPDYRARSGGFVDRRSFGPGPSAGAPWSRPPAGPPPADLLGEDEELVAGRHPVEEAFIAHRKAIRLLVVPQRRLALEKLVLHATNLRIPIVEVEGGTLTSLAGFDGHQGIALVTDRRKFAGLDDILARAIERGEAPFVLVLDSLEDPQNFGSLLRTAEASGVHGVVYPVRRQAPLSAAAVKASAGAVEHLLLVPVEDLAEALTDLHVRGLRVIGSDADASLTARQADLRGPVVVVVGSEGQGLGPAVRRRCDTVVRIPMRGRVTSLNAAVAGSILLYEASSQRGGDRPVVGPEPGLGEEIARIRGPVADREPGPADATSTDQPADADRLDAAALAADADRLAADQAAIAGEAELAPAPRPKTRRRKTVPADPIDATAASEEDALLPGSSAIDSSDASTAQ